MLQNSKASTLTIIYCTMTKLNRLQESAIPKGEKSLQILTFFLNGHSFALPVGAIREVNRVDRVRPIPGAPASVLGLIDLHGKAVPLINLKRRIGIEPSALHSGCKWIAVREGESSVCIAVDGLHRFYCLDAGKIDDLPSYAVAGGAEYILYNARAEGKILPILNMETILSDRFVDTVFELSSTGGFADGNSAGLSANAEE